MVLADKVKLLTSVIESIVVFAGILGVPGVAPFSSLKCSTVMPAFIIGKASLISWYKSNSTASLGSVSNIQGLVEDNISLPSGISFSNIFIFVILSLAHVKLSSYPPLVSTFFIVILYALRFPNILLRLLTGPSLVLYS